MRLPKILRLPGLFEVPQESKVGLDRAKTSRSRLVADVLRCEGFQTFGSLSRERISQRKDTVLVIAEVSIFPLGTGTPSVSEYVSAALKELEASGLKCTLGPMGTTVEAESTEEAYAAIARAQAAVFDLGVGRAYTVIKMDERRDVEGRSADDMVRSVQEKSNAR
jgi:uncharacterized protein (TIGR00106 family)